MAWITGYPFSVNFALGYPVSNPGEFSAVDVLARKECDAALIIASDPVANFPAESWKHLADIPTIVLDPKVSLTSKIAKVSIPVATAGIEAEGTAYRMDGVPLRLKKVMDTNRLSDAAVLAKMIEKVRA
jgi:formylmethanofuran dehydrogenase subunit B